jgi:predicted O-methyltransferase YrrM
MIKQEDFEKLLNQEPAVFSQVGQITTNTQAGQQIIKTLITFKPRKILEIGTWNGLGTTRCILQALQTYDFDNFTSLECNTIKHNLAINNNKDLINNKTHLINATILDEQDWKDAREMYKNDIVQEWFDTDYKYSKRLKNIYEELSDFDAVLLDGGEYTTYAEFKKLLPLCTRLILLDDTKTCKCAKIVEELNNNPDWQLFFQTDERNGFAIYMKKE